MVGTYIVEVCGEKSERVAVQSEQVNQKPVTFIPVPHLQKKTISQQTIWNHSLSNMILV